MNRKSCFAMQILNVSKMSKFNYILNTNNNNYSWRHHILLHTVCVCCANTISNKYATNYVKIFHALVSTAWASQLCITYIRQQICSQKLLQRSFQHGTKLQTYSFCLHVSVIVFVIIHVFPRSLNLVPALSL